MNYKPEKLKPGTFFHIYNRGNNGDPIFFDDANYYHFLKLYQKYISPVADTYAWCLLENHIHLLVYIRQPHEIQYSSLRYSTVDLPRVIDIARQFSHLFNAYTQAINKRYARSGSLFEKPFRRTRVPLHLCFREMVYYVHNNPVQHGLTTTASEYRWSSFNPALSINATLRTDIVFAAFGGRESFIDFHKQHQKLTKITKFIIE